MARSLLDVPCHTTRSRHCCGNIALGGLLGGWASQAEHFVCCGAVRSHISPGLRFLRENACPLHPVGSSLPSPQPCAPCPRLLCFCTSTTTLGRKAVTSRAEPTGTVDGLAWVLLALRNESPATSCSTGENRSGTPYTLFAENNLSLTGTELFFLDVLP